MEPDRSHVEVLLVPPKLKVNEAIDPDGDQGRDNYRLRRLTQSGLPIGVALRRFTRPNGIAVRPKLPCLVFSTSTGEGVDARTKLHVNEPSASDHRFPSCTRQGTGNSTGPEVDVT